TQKNESENVLELVPLLRDSGLLSRGEAEEPLTSLVVQRLAGDGSSRKFWRVGRKDGEKICLAVAPAGRTEQDMQEAGSSRLIGVHLHERGVRVPAQYGWDAEAGLLLFEDLGDVKLHDLVEQSRNQSGELDLPALRPWYVQAVQQLALMQIHGAVDFNCDWCWDTREYDRPLMLNRESGYFLRAFWQELLGQELLPGIKEEFEWVATAASQAPATLFLHRDFQSRNIMVQNGQLSFIDFQGGRMGPLGYDLASLLIDPYTALPSPFQEELIRLYLDALKALYPVDARQFRREYCFLALQRNLQIIGAFSFLSRVRGKAFFARFIVPALLSLDERLRDQELSDLQVLPFMVTQALKLLR
ncbi:MAG: phosphotransferase, partial [Proteobacteria bacterium]|nr:phosphotransferase [Pseudomonadota bacterium]